MKFVILLLLLVIIDNRFVYISNLIVNFHQAYLNKLSSILLI